VLVIGAGITGAMIADAVVESGLSVVMVDRRGAALVQYKIDTPLIYLARKIGKANAVRAWRRWRLAAGGWRLAVDAIAARLLGVQKPPALSTQALSCGGREPPTMT
jgi:3-hydroxyacyl-CoA dehydrogenase